MTDEKDLMQIDEGTSAAEGSFGLLSVPEVSKLTGYHRDYVTYLARVGKLAAKKVGRNWVVSREAVDNLLNAANGHTEVADEMGNKIPVHVENYEQTERAKLQKLKSEVRNSISEVKQKAELEKVAQQNLQNAQVIEKQISSKLGDFESNLKKEFELLLDKKVANIPISAIRVISAPSSVYDPAKFEKTAPTIALSSFDPQSDLSKEILAVKTPTLNVEKIYSSFRHRFDLVKYFAYGFAVLTFTIGAAAVYNYKNTEDKIAKIKTEQTQLASKPEMIVVQPEQKEKDEEKIPEIVVTPPTTTTSGETKIIYVVGKPGPQGPRGPQGVQGEQGPAGADGKDGANGTVAYQPAYVVTPLPGYTGPNSSGSTFLSGTNISGQELNISGTANISTANITNLTSTTQNIANGIYITGNAPYLETTSPGATLFINTVSNNPVEFGSGAITSAGPLTLLSTSQPQVTLGYNSTNKWTSSTANTGATTFAFNGATPSVTFTPANDTVTAFNFTKADSTSVFNVDTANGRVGINNSAPTVALDVTGAANISGAAALGGNLTLSAVNPVIDTTDSGSTLNINTVTNRPVNFGTGDVTIPNLVVSTSQINSGTVNITSNVTTGTAFSLTGNDITSGTLFSKNMTANAGNGQVSKGGVINVVDNTTAGGGYSALTINITGSGTGSGTKTILDLNPGVNKQVVFDNTGAFRPTVSSAQNTNSIGSPSYYWKNGYFDTINANSLAGTVITGATSSNTWTIGSSETGDTNKAIVLQRNSGSGNATIQWNAGTNDLRYLTVNYPFNSTYTVSDASIGTNVNLFSGLLTNNTTTGTQQLLALTNTGTGTTEKGLYINNTGTGTTAMQVDGTWTNALLIGPNAGKVGIGTSTPSTALHVYANANSPVTVENSASSSAFINFKSGATSKGYLGYSNLGSAGLAAINAAGGAVNMLITDAGNVGLGTTTPAAVTGFGSGRTLHIEDTTTNLPNIRVQSTNITGLFGVDSGNAYIGTTSAAGGLKVVTGSTSNVRMYVDASGNVGIGTAAPTSLVQVNQPTAGAGTITVTAAGTTVTGVGTQFTNTFKIGDTITANAETHTITAIASDTSMTTDAWTGAASGVAYTLTGGTRFVVKGNGYIGIGTVSPTSVLHLAPTVSDTGSNIVTRFQPTLNVSASGFYNMYANSLYTGTGTLTTGVAQYGIMNNNSSGTITNASGVRGGVNNNSTGTVANAYSLYSNAVINTGGGTVTNAYGLYLEGQTVGTNNYGIYQAGAGTNVLNGNLGVGTSSVSENLTIGTSTNATDLTFGMRALTAGGASSRTIFTQGATTGALTIAVDQGQNGSARALAINVGATTNALYINGSGNVGIGTTTPGGLLDVKGSKLNVIVSSSGQLSMLGTDETAGAQTDLTMRIGANNATSPNIIIQKGRSNAGAALATNDPMGTLQFQGGTGSAFAESARIRAIATGAFSPTSLPSALTFWTTAGSSTTVSERMRIDAAGNVGIGTTNPTEKLEVSGNLKVLSPSASPSRSFLFDPTNYNIASYFNGGQRVTLTLDLAAVTLKDAIRNNSYFKVYELGAGTYPDSVGVNSVRPQGAQAGQTPDYTSVLFADYVNAPQGFISGKDGSAGSPPVVGFIRAGNAASGATDIIGANLVLQGGKGTGVGVPGDIILQTGDVLASGGTLQSVSAKVTVKANGNVGIGTSAPSSLLQINQPTSGVGTVTVTAAGTTVTGVGTQFTNTFKIGDTITANAETHTITAIASDTSMTTDAWTGAASGVAYTLTGGTRFVVKGNGNIGIGLTNPGMALDIVGNTRTSGYLAAGGSIYTNFGTTGFGTIYGSTNGNGGGSVVLYQDSHATLPQAVQIKNGTSVNTTFLSGGYVGIGTTSPNRRLVVQGDGTNLTSMFVANNGFVSGTSGSAIALGHGAQTGDTYSYINASTAGGGTSGILALNSNGGNVGIGTTNPARRFVVQGDGTNLTSMFVANNGFVSGTSGSTIAFGHGAQTGDTYSYINATIAGGGTGGILALNAVGGNVGVGTTAAGAKLHVLGAGNNAPGQVKIESTNTNYAGLSLYNGNTATTANRNWEIANNWASAGNLDFLVSTASTTDPSSVLMSLGSTGNLGLGVSNPTNGKLEVVGDGYFSSTGTTYLTVNRNAITNFGMLRMYTGGSMRWGFGMTNNSTDDLSINTDGTTAGSKIYIQRSSGNVGVGTTSPSVKLHVAAATGVGTTETMRLEVNGNVGADRGPLISFYSPNNSGTSRLTAGITSAQTVAALDQGGYLAFHTNTTGGSALVERMRIDNVGNVGIGVTTMTSKLQVAGDLATTISSSVYGQFEVTGATDATKRLALGFNTTGNYGIIQSLITSNNYYPLMLNPNGSGVGIGTTALNTTFNPKLQIKNTAVDATNPVMSVVINRQNSDVAGLMLGMDAGQYGVISSNGTTGIRFGQNSTGSTAFTEYMRILTGGNVGIGTTNPNNLLTVNGTAQAATFYSTTASTNDAIYLDKSGDAGRQWIAWHQGSGTADWRVGMLGPAYDLTFYNAAGAASSAASPGAAYLTMQQSTGNIGIGITNPGKILDIMATSGSDGLRINRVAASTAAGGSQINSDAVIGGVNTNLWTLGDYSNSDDGVILLNRLNAPLYLGTNNTERITILGDGNVGIGTTNPQAKFHVGAGDMLLDYGGYYLAGRNFAGTGNLGLVNLQTAGLNNNVMSLYEGKAVILSSGNVGIGTTNPITKLQVAGAGSNTTVGSAFAAITLENSDATVNNWVGQGYYGSDKTGYIGYTGFQITDHLAKYGDYAITTRGAVGYTEKLRVTSEGNLGIGITNPSSGLHLATGTFGAPATGGSAANGFLRINNPATSAPGLDFGLNVSGTAYAWLQSRDYNNYANNYALAINPNGGNVGIGTTSPNYKLEIGQSATQTIALSNSNIAHGMTDQALTNVGAVYGLLSSTTGGALLQGFSDADATGFRIEAAIGAADPTDTIPAILLRGSKKNLTNLQELGALETLFQVQNMLNTPSFSILGNGNIGIGTTSPAGILDVRPAEAASGVGSSVLIKAQKGAAANNGGNILISSGDNGVGGNNGYIGFGIGAVITGTNFSAGEAMRIAANGSIGIGTTGPSTTLDVRSANDIGLIVGRSTASGATGLQLLGGAGSTHYNWQIGKSQTVGSALEFTPSTAADGTTFSTPAMVILSNGNIGIGTTNPNTKLEVAGVGRFTDATGFSIGSDPNQNRLQWNGSNFAFLNSANTYAPLAAKGLSIGGVYGDTAPPTNGMIVEGNVGIGTTNPSVRLQVVDAGGVNMRLTRNGTLGSWDFGISNIVSGSTGGDLAIDASGVAQGLIFRPRTSAGSQRTGLAISKDGSIGIGTATEFGSGAGVIGILNATTDPTTNPTGAGILYVSGGALKYRGSSGTVTTVAAADYAEDMPYLGTLSSGEVVQQSSVANPNAEGIYNKFFVERADTPYADGILGIVSSFQGSNQTSTMPIALVGRVPVKITDENGAVKVGDYLTASASMPGYAMKATVSGKVIGQVLSEPDTTNIATQVINGVTIQTTTALTFVKVGYQNINNMMALGNDPLAIAAAAAVANGNTAETQGNAAAGSLGAAEQGLTMVIRQAVNNIEKDSSGNKVAKAVTADILQLQSGKVTRLMVAASGATVINSSISETSSEKIFVISNNGSEKFSISAKGTLVASATLVVKKDVVAIGAVLGSTGILARNADTVEVEQGDLVMFKGVEDKDILSSVGMNNPVLSVSKAAYDSSVGAGSVIVVGIADRNMSDFDIPGAGTSAAANATIVPSGEFLSVITAGTYSAVNADASNASIAVGDKLTLSTVAGKVRKLQAGENMPVVGIALDTLASGSGKIRIFLNISNAMTAVSGSSSTSSGGSTTSSTPTTEPVAPAADTTTTDTTAPADTTTTTTDPIAVTDTSTSAPLDVTSSPVDTGTSSVASDTTTATN